MTFSRRLCPGTIRIAAVLLAWGIAGCSQHTGRGNQSVLTNLDSRESLSLMCASADLAFCEFGRSDAFGLTIDASNPKQLRRIDMGQGLPSKFSPMIANPDKLIARIRDYSPDWSDRGVATRFTGDGLCIRRRATDSRNADPLADIDAEFLPDQRIRLTFTSSVIENFYGLGEQFHAPGVVNGDWGGRTRTPGCEFGNALVQFHGGYVGNAQFPILYCVGDDHQNFAIFIDDISPHTWDFTKTETADASGVRTWTLTVPPRTEPLRWFVLTGDDLPGLRTQYMELVGKPPVPPRETFGLWLSEYGFNDWNELDDKLRTLRANHFPIDGFVLDLQWFGDIRKEYKGSQMGSLTWDTDKFPNPAAKIAELREKEGVGIAVIEESYVDAKLPEHASLASRGYLVRNADGNDPARIESWWGNGGMIDWTNEAGADDWHDTKRAPLIAGGVAVHWTDLGEPEAYRKDFWYQATAVDGSHAHADAHNLFNFRWAQSIDRGYRRHGAERPPVILSRSGTSGIQRFGAAMWSGDIGSNLASLASHLNVQMHMSMSGVDYFGSDVGGFRRDSLMGDTEDEMYTRWFAHAAMLDVPFRPHTSNTENKYETAPDRVGDLKSNLFNLRRRYALTPYLYSLATRAAETGEPIFPPLVYYYQDDNRVREIADQKMIGRDLMVVMDVVPGQRRTKVYLPAGDWYDFETGTFYPGDTGREITIDPRRPDGIFTLPLFARAGAIISMMHVDEKTMNVTGKRTDGSRRDELMLHVFADNERTHLSLHQDTNPQNYSTFISQGLTDLRKVEKKVTLIQPGNVLLDLSITSPDADRTMGNDVVAEIQIPEYLKAVRRIYVGSRPIPIVSFHNESCLTCESYSPISERGHSTAHSEPIGWFSCTDGRIEVVARNIKLAEGVQFLIECEPDGRVVSASAR